MTLGTEFVELIQELISGEDGIGSQMTWRHLTRTENAATGAVASVVADEVFVGAVTDPVRLRLFSETSVATSTCAVVIPVGAMATAPKLEDQVSVEPGRFLRIVELKAIYGPGGTGAPVLIAYAAAVVG